MSEAATETKIGVVTIEQGDPGPFGLVDTVTCSVHGEVGEDEGDADRHVAENVDCWADHCGGDACGGMDCICTHQITPASSGAPATGTEPQGIPPSAPQDAEYWHRRWVASCEREDRVGNDLVSALTALASLQEIGQALLATCRECRDEDAEIQPAVVIIWGKLSPPEALGPRCYDHAVKHLGHAAMGQLDQWAVVDLRPLRVALAGGA